MLSEYRNPGAVVRAGITVPAKRILLCVPIPGMKSKASQWLFCNVAYRYICTARIASISTSEDRRASKSVNWIFERSDHNAITRAINFQTSGVAVVCSFERVCPNATRASFTLYFCFSADSCTKSFNFVEFIEKKNCTSAHIVMSSNETNKSWALNHSKLYDKPINFTLRVNHFGSSTKKKKRQI